MTKARYRELIKPTGVRVAIRGDADGEYLAGIPPARVGELPDTAANEVARLIALEAAGEGIFKTAVVFPTANLPEPDELVAAPAIGTADA